MKLPELNLSNKEFRLFAVASVVLLVWVYFGMNLFVNSFNFLAGYIIFLAAYIYIVLRYVLNIKLTPTTFVAFTMVFLALDIILFPIMIPKDAPVMLSGEQKLSSDVFIYGMLPDMPHPTKYFITYVVSPLLLLLAARMLTTRKGFQWMVKTNA